MMLAASVPLTATECYAIDTSMTAAAEARYNRLIEDVLTTYGGLEKLKENREKAFKSHGTVSVTSGISGASNAFECDIFERGDKLRMEMTVLGQPMIMGHDGSQSWTQFGDWVSLSSNTASTRMADEIKHGLPALIDVSDPRSRIEVLPKQTIRGKSCEVFKVISPDGKATTFYADPESHLILRSEYMGTDHELGTPSVQGSEYYDYRAVAGTQLPFRCVQFSGSKKNAETVLQSIAEDNSISPSQFEMPKESEIARLKEGPVTIPFEFVGNEVLVTVRINNQKEAKFIVDTGASQSVIDKETAQLIGPYTVSTFSITAGSKAVPLSYTKIPALTLGDVTMNDVPALVTDLSSFAPAVGEKPAGLIGANVLRRFLVTIDYADKKLILSDPKTVTVPEDAHVIHTSPVFGATALVVKGKLDDKTDLNFLVDTGAAFNNLPVSLAKPFFSGQILPVGQIYGLDGQRIDIGSIKLKQLKIGALTLDQPVFAMAPDNASSQTSNGLFTAGGMGILGNPIWSQFRMTIDYRNERLILESPPGREKFLSLKKRLEKADLEHLDSRESDAAIKEYKAILTATQTEQSKAAEALCLSRIADCYTERYAKTKDAKWLEAAGKEYEQASKLAVEARNKSVEGEILAQWALMFAMASRNQNDVTGAQSLLVRALKKAPMEPNIYAALGTAMMRFGKKAFAEKLLNQAIMLDPSNWQALWSKYKLTTSQNNPGEQAMVVAQLQRYYPTMPEVLAISKSGRSARSAPPAGSSTVNRARLPERRHH
jgi:tetratricopeptide (TPR) repeat protein/predicted aspartyl protease